MSDPKKRRITMEDATAAASRPSNYNQNNASVVPNHTPASSNYSVVRGDNLSLIAKRHNMSVNDLIKDNPHIKNPDVIRTGDKLFVRGDRTNTTTTKAVEEKPTSATTTPTTKPTHAIRSVTTASTTNQANAYYPKSVNATTSRRTMRDTRPYGQRIIDAIFGSDKTSVSTAKPKTKAKAKPATTYYPKSANATSSKQVTKDTRSRWERMWGL